MRHSDSLHTYPSSHYDDHSCLLIPPVRQQEINDQALLSACAAAIDVYFLVYILMARRVRLAFSEFPAPLGAPDPVKPAGR
jgi:hypothetical protein